jgi:hypothetical protein
MKWLKQGRIFDPNDDSPEWSVTHATLPFAEKVNEDLYKIYFSGRDKHNRSLPGHIVININQPNRVLSVSDKPILECGPPGTFDDSGVMSTWLLNYKDKKYLYYVGWNLGVTVPFRNAIGLAISDDGGQTFIKWSEGPLLDRSRHDPGFTASLCVLVENDVWRMWYLSCIKWEIKGSSFRHYYHIKYAESKDGFEWERKGLVCIDFKSSDEYAISRPCVIKEEEIYKMWYSYRGKSYRIGYAESPDGLNWQRKDEEVGIDVSQSGWDSEMIEYSFVFDHQRERFMLYNGNGYGKTGIGLAVLAKER